MKIDYDPEHEIFEFGNLLPEGLSFPLDFGFIPSTLGEDGDPVDVLVFSDEPAPVGCMMDIRLIGVTEGKQTEKGETKRNDRLFGVAIPSFRYGGAKKLEDIGTEIFDHIEHFFVSYNQLRGREYEIQGRFGPDRANQLVKKGIEEAKRRG